MKGWIPSVKFKFRELSHAELVEKIAKNRGMMHLLSAKAGKFFTGKSARPCGVQGLLWALDL